MMMTRCFRSGVGDNVRGKSAQRKKKKAVLRTELCSKSILPCNVNAIFNDLCKKNRRFKRTTSVLLRLSGHVGSSAQ